MEPISRVSWRSSVSGKLLAVDEAPTVKEGDWPYTRTVLIEFPDAEAFDV